MSKPLKKIPVHLEFSKQELKYFTVLLTMLHETLESGRTFQEYCALFLNELESKKKEPDFERFVWGMILKFSEIDSSLNKMS